MRLVLLGKPGSGKGTQAKHISAQFTIPAMSTGDLFRAARGSGSALGKRVAEYMKRGQLLPDELVVDAVFQRLDNGDKECGFLLDGFPRSIGQAQELDAWLSRRGCPLDAAVYICVPDEILVRRAVGRRMCPADGSSYHVEFSPPARQGVCDACGGELEQRDDDRTDVVRVRLQEYAEKTEPLVAFYSEAGLLREVDGRGSIEEVRGRIRHELRPSAADRQEP